VSDRKQHRITPLRVFWSGDINEILGFSLVGFFFIIFFSNAKGYFLQSLHIKRQWM